MSDLQRRVKRDLCRGTVSYYIERNRNKRAQRHSGSAEQHVPDISGRRNIVKYRCKQRRKYKFGDSSEKFYRDAEYRKRKIRFYVSVYELHCRTSLLFIASRRFQSVTITVFELSSHETLYPRFSATKRAGV